MPRASQSRRNLNVAKKSTGHPQHSAFIDRYREREEQQEQVVSPPSSPTRRSQSRAVAEAAAAAASEISQNGSSNESRMAEHHREYRQRIQKKRLRLLGERRKQNKRSNRYR
jgi:hypothetical protein